MTISGMTPLLTRGLLHRKCALTPAKIERKIDRLVYRLYELTDDEIAIVEEDSK